MIAGHYVVRFRAQLSNETDPAKRSALRRLLVEEEDRLGATFELLAEVQQVIIDCKQRIAEPRCLVGNMKVDGRDASVVERWLCGCGRTTASLSRRHISEHVLATANRCQHFAAQTPIRRLKTTASLSPPHLHLQDDRSK